MSNNHVAEMEVGEFGKNKNKKHEQRKEKWVKNYSSNHQTLLVREGDLSFSLSLARSFGSASNILAYSLDSYDVLIKKYKEAKSNLQNLEKMGAYLLHGVNATRMKFHTDLRMRKFDRIVFNFPHAGFYGKEDNALLIKMHKDLVNGFFRHASCMLRANGEIHVNHKTTAPFCDWNIQELASHNSLALVECVDFKKDDYPGYKNKRGDGSKCDKAFPLGECSTFKFILSRTTENLPGRTHLTSSVTGRCQRFQETPIQMQQFSTSTCFSYPQEGHSSNMEHISGCALLPLTTNPINQLHLWFDGHLNHPTEMFGRGNYNLSSSLDTYGLHSVPGRTLNGDIYVLRELGHMMQFRRWLYSNAQVPRYQ
ncbi:hypothetical protein CJ030_MR4G018809 [Morella rubra]|uniref:25S rRNA (uridine-N(3))-methyltransferase BMT5-like domain-containing protein n=1 Tax=Morella rubra TaxID=262757 RepID=A0A6A1VQ64_9ROSI|nr:hypothetical protein CJ030_MR8G028118 [Morella rubra]KAB1215024.1 hypothetical protein CJ030_MR4G018809 [Morella rubra]